jgi:hypothetical protein
VSFVDALVVVLLEVWFVLSIVQQFGPSWFERVREFDIFGLLPLWTFFAPNPGHSDYHLVYRDRAADGTLTAWQELVLAEERDPSAFLWNPQKRSKKVLADVAATLAEYGNLQVSEDALMLSLPYLILLNVVSALEPHESSERQFALVETFGFRRFEPNRVLLVSDFHTLSAETS